MSEDIKNSTEMEDMPEIEKEKMDDDHWHYHGTQNWAWGASLILVGVLFLLDNFGLTMIRSYNWWAIFILAPGLSMLSRAYQHYSETKTFTRSSRRNGIFGLVLVLVAFSFLFGIGFGIIWPVALISAGVYLLLGKK